MVTKAAMVKKKEERGMFITSRFYGDDYVSFQVIKAVLGVSFGFVLVVALWFMENSEALLTACSVEELFLILKSMWILYLMLVLATILISVLVYYFCVSGVPGISEGVYLQPEKRYRRFIRKKKRTERLTENRWKRYLRFGSD